MYLLVLRSRNYEYYSSTHMHMAFELSRPPTLLARTCLLLSPCSHLSSGRVRSRRQCRLGVLGVILPRTAAPAATADTGPGPTGVNWTTGACIATVTSLRVGIVSVGGKRSQTRYNSTQEKATRRTVDQDSTGEAAVCHGTESHQNLAGRGTRNVCSNTSCCSGIFDDFLM